MKRTANKFQRAYMVAKARVQEVESQQEAIEKKFIADKGIVNPDGSVPEFLYCMEDDAAFEKANDECAVLIVSAGLEEELNAARSVLDCLRSVPCSRWGPGHVGKGRSAQRRNPRKGP